MVGTNGRHVLGETPNKTGVRWARQATPIKDLATFYENTEEKKIGLQQSTARAFSYIFRTKPIEGVTEDTIEGKAYNFVSNALITNSNEADEKPKKHWKNAQSHFSDLGIEDVTKEEETAITDALSDILSR